jgi:hypothetical protein
MSKKTLDTPGKGSRSSERKSRRELLRDVGLVSLGAILAKPIDGIWTAVHGVITDIPRWADRSLMLRILNLRGTVQFFAGSTNKRKAFEGGEGISVYLRNSAKTFSSYVIKAMGGESRFREVDETDARLGLNLPENDVILLGGPVANNLAALLTGHRFTRIQKTQRTLLLPHFDLSSGLRWGFFCGDDDYGVWKGQELKASRYDDEKLVERHLYGLWDTARGDAQHPRRLALDSSGFLAEEALLVSRVPNPYDRTKAVLILGGVHGYSTLAFCSNLEPSLENVVRLQANREFFQLLVPAALSHDHKLRHTYAELQWDRAQVFTME